MKAVEVGFEVAILYFVIQRRREIKHSCEAMRSWWIAFLENIFKHVCVCVTPSPSPHWSSSQRLMGRLVRLCCQARFAIPAFPVYQSAPFLSLWLSGLIVKDVKYWSVVWSFVECTQFQTDRLLLCSQGADLTNRIGVGGAFDKMLLSCVALVKVRLTSFPTVLITELPSYKVCIYSCASSFYKPTRPSRLLER